MKSSWTEDELVFLDSTTIEPISNELLDKKLNIDFYKTTLLTANMEYPDLEVIVTADLNSGTSKLLKSPVFESPDPEFLTLFDSIKLSNYEEQPELAKAISELFVAITKKGQIELLETKFLNEQAVELWHGDLSWRILNFEFSDQNELTRIRIEPGFARKSPTSNYKRITRE